MAGQVTQTMVAIAPGRYGSPQAYGQGVGTFQRGSDLYLVCSNPGYGQFSWVNDNVDGDPPPVLTQARVLKSQDNGATWLEVSVDNGPVVSIQKSQSFGRGVTSPIAATYQDANTLLVAYWVWDYVYANAPTLRFSTFSMATDTWGAETAGGPAVTEVPNQPDLNMSIAYRSGDGALIILYDSYEIVAAVNYCRMFYVIYNAGWGAPVAIDAAQTGSTDDYTMGGAVTGGGGRTHLFYHTNVGGTSNLLQSTLTSLDVLVAAVTITTLVDSSIFQLPPKFAPWGTPVTRIVAGVTHLFIPYVKDGTIVLTFQHAISVNVPVFAEVSIGVVNSVQAGIFNCGGLTTSQGLAAATIETDQVLTGSQDVTTWEATTVVAIPAPGLLAMNYFGLGISAGDGGFQSAGICINALNDPPA